jgi:hypothetical protein
LGCLTFLIFVWLNGSYRQFVISSETRPTFGLEASSGPASIRLVIIVGDTEKAQHSYRLPHHHLHISRLDRRERFAKLESKAEAAAIRQDAGRRSD